ALTPGSTPVTIAERPFWAEVTSWSPDGVWIAFHEAATESSDDLYAVRTDGSGEVRPIATDQGRQFQAEISPDGRWVAYVSETSGRREIYIDAFPNLNARRQVTTGGGDQPQWVEDAEVTFVRGDTVFAQTVNLGSSFETVGRPLPLFHFSDQDFLFFPSYDYLFRYEASPDGQRFLVRVHRPETLAREGKVMTGWLEQLKGGS
ncbi:MAG: TolB family protein, partial [Longimicrobiales bacterium]